MRIIPIVLANWHNSDKMLIEVWRNSIITHGHPRAIIGALAYAITAHIILEGVRNYSKIKSKILVFLSLENIQRLFGKKFEFWLKEWDEKSDHLFLESWELAVNEIEIGLNHIPSSLRSDDIDFYKHLGAVSPQTRGSGIVSFIVCFYMFLKYSTDPYDGLIRMVNIKGSDTDTLASLTCVLWGLLHGTSALPSSFQQSLQDRDYIEKVSFDLLKIHQENYSKKIIRESFSKKDALLSALAWEIGLHDMFWDALDINKKLSHPIFGVGTISAKLKKEIPNQDGYHAKLIQVKFEIGQSCWFHSRVKENGEVVTSLYKELKKAIRSLERSERKKSV